MLRSYQYKDSQKGFVSFRDRIYVQESHSIFQSPNTAILQEPRGFRRSLEFTNLKMTGWVSFTIDILYEENMEGENSPQLTESLKAHCYYSF